MNDTVLTVLTKIRRRNHQTYVLVSIEQNLRSLVRTVVADGILWKGKKDVFRQIFVR